MIVKADNYLAITLGGGIQVLDLLIFPDATPYSMSRYSGVDSDGVSKTFVES